MLRRFRESDPLDTLEPVVTAAEVLNLAAMCRQVFVHPAMEDYILSLVRVTRGHEGLALGASPRATLALYHTAQALAALRGRAYVIPDDVQQLVRPVLAHRLISSSRLRLRGETIAELLRTIVTTVPVPVEENWAGMAARGNLAEDGTTP
jgi:MoxR-like ATPase